MVSPEGALSGAGVLIKAWCAGKGHQNNIWSRTREIKQFLPRLFLPKPHRLDTNHTHVLSTHLVIFGIFCPDGSQLIFPPEGFKSSFMSSLVVGYIWGGSSLCIHQLATLLPGGGGQSATGGQKELPQPQTKKRKQTTPLVNFAPPPFSRKNAKKMVNYGKLENGKCKKIQIATTFSVWWQKACNYIILIRKKLQLDKKLLLGNVVIRSNNELGCDPNNFAGGFRQKDRSTEFERGKISWEHMHTSHPKLVNFGEK